MHVSDLSRPALEVAPQLLGARLRVTAPDGTVIVRITEVEAYHGQGSPGPYDAGSHARSGPTARNAAMFGPPAHAYVYFSYGMHYAINFVCGPVGVGSGVLVRAGEVVSGEALARSRRSARRTGSEIAAHQLARGPGNLAQALGIRRETHDGAPLSAEPFGLELPQTLASGVLQGPRVGVAGAAGGSAFPWRFWLDGEPTVSAFRPGRGAERMRGRGDPLDANWAAQLRRR